MVKTEKRIMKMIEGFFHHIFFDIRFFDAQRCEDLSEK